MKGNQDPQSSSPTVNFVYPIPNKASSLSNRKHYSPRPWQPSLYLCAIY